MECVPLIAKNIHLVFLDPQNMWLNSMNALQSKDMQFISNTLQIWNLKGNFTGWKSIFKEVKEEAETNFFVKKFLGLTPLLKEISHSISINQNCCTTLSYFCREREEDCSYFCREREEDYSYFCREKEEFLPFPYRSMSNLEIIIIWG